MDILDFFVRVLDTQRSKGLASSPSDPTGQDTPCRPWSRRRMGWIALREP